MLERLSVWLLPARSELDSLRAHIERIARQLGSPSFCPHVTLIGDFRAERPPVERALARAAPRLRSLSLQPRSFSTSQSRFQALTVRFEPSSDFDALTHELTDELHVEPAQVPPAHLSLAYPFEPFDPAALPPLAADISLKHPFRFDSLALVAPGAGHDDWQAVHAWQAVGCYPLQARASVGSR